jgi:hypothetical protein
VIVHASIPADDTRHVAEVLAELWKGEAVPFPPVPGSWLAYPHDDGRVRDTADAEALRLPSADPDRAERRGGAGRRTSRGLARSTLPPRRAGEMGFDLIELWLENAFMLEVVTARCMQAMSPS